MIAIATNSVATNKYYIFSNQFATTNTFCKSNMLKHAIQIASYFFAKWTLESIAYLHL